MAYKDGSKYTGAWLNDHKHGQGLLEFANGETFEGKWLSNQRAEDGTLRSSSGTILYKGI